MSKPIASAAEVALRNVRFSHGDAAMLFDFVVEAGEAVAVMGPSGSGKTTLLNLIAGFERPDDGRVEIGGRDVTALDPSQRPVSMIFQENNLFAHLDVAANVGLGISSRLRLDSSQRDQVAGALAAVGLAGKERRLPGNLSGGERQRVALARALVRRRPVLLLDEPFASLGPALRIEMIELVIALLERFPATTLMVTHHPDDARRLASRIIHIEDGRVEASGPTEAMLSGTQSDAFRRYVGL